MASQIRQRLIGAAPAGKRLRPCALYQRRCISDVEMVRRVDSLHLFPRDRNGHWSIFASADAVGHHCGRATLVAQIIDEDPPFSLRLRKRGGEVFGIALCDRLRKPVGEVLDLWPLGLEARAAR